MLYKSSDYYRLIYLFAVHELFTTFLTLNVPTHSQNKVFEIEIWLILIKWLNKRNFDLIVKDWNPDGG